MLEYREPPPSRVWCEGEGAGEGVRGRRQGVVCREPLPSRVWSEGGDIEGLKGSQVGAGIAGCVHSDCIHHRVLC